MDNKNVKIVLGAVALWYLFFRKKNVPVAESKAAAVVNTSVPAVVPVQPVLNQVPTIVDNFVPVVQQPERIVRQEPIIQPVFDDIVQNPIKVPVPNYVNEYVPVQQNYPTIIDQPVVKEVIEYPVVYDQPIPVQEYYPTIIPEPTPVQQYQTITQEYQAPFVSTKDLQLNQNFDDFVENRRIPVNNYI